MVRIGITGEVKEDNVKFDRQALASVVNVQAEVFVSIEGETVDGTPFEGTTTIRTIENRAGGMGKGNN